MTPSPRPRRWLPAALATLTLAAIAPPAGAAVTFERIKGYDEPSTPAKYDKVGILKVGSPKARNILVLVPGTSASAAFFAPVAKTIVAKRKGWQVWAVERRENLLEDHSMADRAKAGKATGQQLFDYYLGYLTNSSVSKHATAVADADVPFARQWGMQVAVEDIRRVVTRAQKLGGKVVLGGHSLGGTITTAYATWDFKGKPGAKGLSGLVFVDGGSGTTPVTAEQATTNLQSLRDGTPWLAFGGIPAPFAGLFNIVASTLVVREPNAPAKLGTWSLLPANLKPPVEATNAGGYGYALDTATSPVGLAAAQAHLGRLAASGNPRGWDDAGELTPLRRMADVFSGTGLKGLDGTAWYHPRRLTIDAGAVGNGIANPAQDVLDVHATHGKDLQRIPIFAFAAALGAQRVVDGATALAAQAGTRKRDTVILDRHTTYAHVDPLSAAPGKNDFVKRVVPFLGRIAK
jgi:pimeloyl-ACP methyl ester carboxylesterase